jgi:hypothetical protein
VTNPRGTTGRIWSRGSSFRYSGTQAGPIHIPHALRPGSQTGLTSDGAHDEVAGGGGTDAGAHGGAHGGGGVYHGGGGMGRPNLAGGGGGGGLHSLVTGFHDHSAWHGEELASGAASITIVNAANASTWTAAR